MNMVIEFALFTHMYIFKNNICAFCFASFSFLSHSALLESQLSAAQSEIAAARAAADASALELSALRTQHQQAQQELQQMQQRNAALNAAANADAGAAERQMRQRVQELETRCFDAERALADAQRSSAQVLRGWMSWNCGCFEILKLTHSSNMCDQFEIWTSAGAR
jgi:hypothetical protein